LQGIRDPVEVFALGQEIEPAGRAQDWTP